MYRQKKRTQKKKKTEGRRRSGNTLNCHKCWTHNPCGCLVVLLYRKIVLVDLFVQVQQIEYCAFLRKDLSHQFIKNIRWGRGSAHIHPGSMAWQGMHTLNAWWSRHLLHILPEGTGWPLMSSIIMSLMPEDLKQWAVSAGIQTLFCQHSSSTSVQHWAAIFLLVQLKSFCTPSWFDLKKDTLGKVDYCPLSCTSFQWKAPNHPKQLLSVCHFITMLNWISENPGCHIVEHPDQEPLPIFCGYTLCCKTKQQRWTDVCSTLFLCAITQPNMQISESSLQVLSTWWVNKSSTRKNESVMAAVEKIGKR